MLDTVSKNLSKVIQIDEKQIHGHLGELVRNLLTEFKKGQELAV